MANNSCIALKFFLKVLCALSTFAVYEVLSDVVIEFEETEFTVSEGVGQVELCLVVRSPIPDVSFGGSYTIGAETVAATAGSADYGEIVGVDSPQLLFTNESRRHCFNVAITNDGLLEDSEKFSVEARENPPVFNDSSGVTLYTSRSSVSITIVDEDEASIGFYPSTYTALEGSMVAMKFGVTSGQLGKNIRVGLTFDHSLNALDVSNVEQLITGFALVRFNQTLTSRDVIRFTVFDDDLVEIDEEYSASLVRVRNSIHGLTFDPTIAKVIIPNNDIAIIGFTQGEYIIPDSIRVTSVTVAIKPPGQFGWPKKAVVTLTAADGITLSHANSEGRTIDLTFNAAKDSFTVSLTISDNIASMNVATPINFLLTLSTSASYVVLGPAEATITVVENIVTCAAGTTTLVITNTTYHWPATVSGVTNYQPCPRPPGSASRYCGGSGSSGGVWSDVDFSQCSGWVASVLVTETSQSQELQPDTVSEVIALTDTILTEEAIVDREVAEQYLDIIDNLQQVNASVLQESEEQSDASLSFRVIESLGRFQDEVVLSPNAINQTEVFARETYAIQVGDIDTESFSGETFSVDLGTFEEALSLNTSIPGEAIQTTMGALVNVTASITVPPELITGLQQGTQQSLETQRLSYGVFLTDILFQSPNQTAYNLSIGTVITAVRLQNFPMNATVSRLIAKSAESSYCVHWKASDKFGEWSSDGCREVESDGVKMTCECSIDRPATHFAVLFDLNPSPLPPGAGTALEVITYLGLIVSVVSLIIMIVTYLSTKGLRSSHHGRIILNICVSLLGLYIFFLFAAHVTGVTALCGLVSALLHYFILVFFGWTAAEAVYLYIKLVKVLGTNKYERGFTWKAGITVWATPALVVTLSLAGYKYYTSKYYCRPTQWPFFFGLLLPAAVIIIFNWVIFIVIMVSIFKHTRVPTATGKKGRIQSIKRKLFTAMALTVTFGLGWGLGLLATSTTAEAVTITFQTIFALFVGSQGLLLLLFHGFRSDKARESWKRWLSFVSAKAFGLNSDSTTNTGNAFTAFFISSLRALKKSSLPESVSGTRPSSDMQAASRTGTTESGISEYDSSIRFKLSRIKVDNNHYKAEEFDYPPKHCNGSDGKDQQGLEKNGDHATTYPSCQDGEGRVGK